MTTKNKCKVYAESNAMTVFFIALITFVFVFSRNKLVFVRI